MKLLLVESGTTGHRLLYHQAIINYVGNKNCVLVTPQKVNSVCCDQIIPKEINLCPRTLTEYIRWIRYIKKIASEREVNVIHFLDGSILFRFFGLCLWRFNNFKTIVTFHHIRNSIWHNLSMRLILLHISFGVVHTEKLYNRFYYNNVKLIHYPHFPSGQIFSKYESREYYSLKQDDFVFLYLGATRYDKGADILVDSLRYVKNTKATVLIAGEEAAFSEEELKKINGSQIVINYQMRHLSEDEWNMALSACDCVVLPYRKIFTGASGPLVEAVWNRKMIIGPNSESIGDIIEKHELGKCFVAEDTVDLAKVLEEAVNLDFIISDRYKLFLEETSVKRFNERYSEIYSISAQ